MRSPYPVCLFIGLLLTLTAGCQSGTKQSDTPALASGTAVVDDDTLAAEAPVSRPEVSPDAFVLIPGERAGVVRPGVSEADLIRLLGAVNVTSADTIWGAEGNFYVGTTLFKGTPDEASVLWKDPARRTQPESVLVKAGAYSEVAPTNGANASRWATQAGLRLGSSLQSVEQLNEKAFSLYGFGWDYGGAVSNWKDGKLQSPGGKSYLSVSFGTGALAPAQEKLAEQVAGDREFSSSNPVMQQLKPTVQSITISFR